MRPKDPTIDNEQQAIHPRRRYALFYWQQEGRFYYLRVTPFGLYIIVLLVAASISALLFLFWSRKSQAPTEGTNINITTRPESSASPPRNLIKVAPPAPTPPKVNNRASENAPKNKN
jgi:hypothetical protein